MPSARSFGASIRWCRSHADRPIAGGRQGARSRRGADDYVTKPFGVNELIARVRAIFRRASRGVSAVPERFTLGAATVDLARQTVTARGREQMLSFYEVEILRMLSERAGQPVSREDILSKIRVSRARRRIERSTTSSSNSKRRSSSPPTGPSTSSRSTALATSSSTTPSPRRLFPDGDRHVRRARGLVSGYRATSGSCASMTPLSRHAAIRYDCPQSRDPTRHPTPRHPARMPIPPRRSPSSLPNRV